MPPRRPHPESYVLGDLFDSDDITKYNIPEYQRPYRWSDDDASEFWSDLFSTSSDSESESFTYMLGVIVVTRDSEEIQIVDGQQRFVTLALMFCAIRDIFKKMQVESDTLQNFIEALDRTATNSRIKLNNHVDDNTLKKIINSKINADEIDKMLKGNLTGRNIQTEGQRALLKNYSLFLKHAEELREKYVQNENGNGLKKIINVINKMKKRNYVVYFEVTDEDQAYQIFRTLNSTGQDLNQAELIKSYLTRTTDDKDDVGKRWNDMFESITNPDKLIFNSLQSRLTDGDVKTKNMYKDAKNTCKCPAEVNTYLDNLEVDLQILKYLNDPDKLQTHGKHAHLVHLLHGINSVDLTYFQRPIIAALREWTASDSRTIKLVDCLLKFFFMYRKVSDRSIDVLRSIARTATKQIIQGNTIEEIFWTILKDSSGNDYIDQKEFDVKLKTYIQKIKHNKIAHYMLASLEFDSHIEGQPLRNNLYDNHQVEHIFPEAPTKTEWPNLAELIMYRYNLGNLTLISPGWNKTMKNSSFKTKMNGDLTKEEYERVSYGNSKLLLNTIYLPDTRQWTPDEVVSRADQLYKKAQCIWNLSSYAECAKEPA